MRLPSAASDAAAGPAAFYVFILSMDVLIEATPARERVEEELLKAKLLARGLVLVERARDVLVRELHGVAAER